MQNIFRLRFSFQTFCSILKILAGTENLETADNRLVEHIQRSIERVSEKVYRFYNRRVVTVVV